MRFRIKSLADVAKINTKIFGILATEFVISLTTSIRWTIYCNNHVNEEIIKLINNNLLHMNKLNFLKTNYLMILFKN